MRKGLADLISLVKDAETGQRGYVITGNESYLEPYQAALPEIKKTVDDVRRLTADNSDQQRRLESASALIDTKLSELKSVIDQRRATGFEAAAKIVSAGQGKATMDQFRAVIGEMDRQEQDLLALRSSQAETGVRITKTIVAGGSVLGTLLVVIIGWLITTSLSAQIGAAVQQVQSSSAELQAAANQQASRGQGASPGNGRDRYDH